MYFANIHINFACLDKSNNLLISNVIIGSEGPSGWKDDEFFLQFFLVRLTGVYIPRSVAGPVVLWCGPCRLSLGWD